MIDYLSTNKCHGILFLDFDGVCNSFETGSYMTHVPSEYGSDPKILKRIQNICLTTNSKIVISSNWRRFKPNGTWRFNEFEYTNPLPNLYSKIGNLISETLPLDRHLTKSQALELWFEDNPNFNGRYAVVDDDPREGFAQSRFKTNFWLIDMKYGITKNIEQEIIEHLK